MAVTITSSTDSPEQMTAAIRRDSSDAGSRPKVTDSANEDGSNRSNEAGSANSVTYDADAPIDKAVKEPEVEADAETDSDTEAETGEAVAGPTGTAAKALTAKEKQDRISRLTWQKYRLQEELDATRAQLAARQQPVAQPAPAQPAPLGDKPVIDNFDTVEAWVDALSDWTRQSVEADLNARSAAAQQRYSEDAAARAHQSTMDAHAARVDAYRAAHPDFDRLAQSALESQLPFTPMMNAHVVNSELGPAVLHFLASHPDECRRIAALPAGPSLIALGRLEAKLEANPASVARPRSSSSPVRSALPEPIVPAGGGSRQIKDPGKMTPREFREWRRQGGGHDRPGR